MVILVVDDEESIRDFVARALMRYFKDNEGNGTVMTVSNFSQASDAILCGSLPDLIISDVNMPGGTGWDLVNFIGKQSDPEISGIPFIMMSGKPDNEKMAKKKDLLFLAKPFGPAELFKVLDEVLLEG